MAAVRNLPLFLTAMNSAWVVTVVAIIACGLVWRRTYKAAAGPLPPGPTPVPLLGNVRDLVAKELWLVATRWAKQFGDIVYVHVLGQGLVFLNSPEATMALLDKKGSIYGDKPALVMAGELCGCENMVAFTRYGETSKRQRKLLTRAFGIQAIPSYHPLIEAETHSFIRRLVAEPSKYMEHSRRYAGGLTLFVVYGYEATGSNDKFLNLGEECVDILSNRITSGGGIWPVDIFPILKHLPTWAPGSSFKIKAAAWKARMEDFIDQPYHFVKSSLKSGNYAPSFCSMLLEDERNWNPQFEWDLKHTANSMFSASMDTTITLFCQFLLAMVLHPEVLAKAQKEIDSVIGPERLPKLSDRASLPYVEAILNETYRWGVPVPLSLPHRLMEDDVYQGMFIPRGSLVFGNVWAIMRDETLFPNASSFLPERYMEQVEPALAQKRDPRRYVFGFGRRRCPGIHLVESSAWLLITTVLATLDISKAKDEFNKPIEPKVNFSNAVFRQPDRFDCDIRPRSERVLKLLTQAEGVRF
ncbi:cytochrome P450 [Mycena belliarum]|uniref:Cytochrome P450 n=1 Tax=Mycena belliarum TaxID=1033014 RepID=A0AAD6TV67_9AGAR|nr:cytochrome P450 [Mycena belliae]